MCGKQAGADVVIAWPSAEIAVMGADGAANVIFRDASEEERQVKIDAYIKEFSTPYQAAKRGFVDQIIVPEQTRPTVIQALEMLASKTVEHPHKKHGNIPL
jgi:acetyl-CoA carboxylase carboxyltransferase component